MKHVRSYGNVTRRWYRPIEHECPECHQTLRQAMTLTRRTVIRLDKVIKLIHAGYRCPDWNAYLLRYGRSVAYYQWWEQDAARWQQLVEQACRLDRVRWQELRREATIVQHEQLTRFRFRHKREAFLASLEDRWVTAVQT